MVVCRVDEEKLDHFNRFVVSFGVRLLPKQLHRKDKQRKKRDQNCGGFSRYYNDVCVGSGSEGQFGKEKKP